MWPIAFSANLLKIMAESNEELLSKELAHTEVEPLSMKDLSQKSDNQVQETDWKSLYEDMQKTQNSRWKKH